MLELRIAHKVLSHPFVVEAVCKLMLSMPAGVSLTIKENDEEKFYLFLGEKRLMRKWLKCPPMKTFSDHFSLRTLPVESQR
jgi:hypothetical protein